MSLVLDQVSIGLGATWLVERFSVTIDRGETVTLMGASGSGKSSLLAFIAGDLPPPLRAQGRVTLDGADILHLPPEARHIGRLFQDDLLFPHLTVLGNLLFGMARGDRQAREARARAALEDAELEAFAARLPHTLSGGQRARIALLRALLAEPRAILLDEPFAKLDAPLRASIRKYTFARIAAQGIPALLVTHDAGDAPPKGRVFHIERGGKVRHA